MPFDLHAFTETEQTILFACAVLNHFDLHLLRALVGNGDEEQEALTKVLHYPFVIPSEIAPAQYTLTESIRALLLDKLQEENFPLYKQFHQRAFAYILKQFPKATENDHRLLEVELFFHLDELFFLLIASNELTQLEEVLQHAHTVELLQRDHLHLRAYYWGCLQNERHRYAEAAASFLAILDAPDLADDLRARTFTALGHNYDYQGIFDKAIQMHTESQTVSARHSDILGESKALNNTAIIYHQLALYDKALPLLTQSYQLAKKIGDLVMQGRALINLGYTAKELGQWDEALAHYQACLAIWPQLGIHEFEARAHNNLGEVYHLLNQIDQATFHFEQALAIVQDPRHENKREAADMLLNLGFLWHTQRQFERAQQHYEQALQLAQALQHRTAISQIHYRLGMLFEETNQLARAQQAYEVAITSIEAVRSTIDEDEVRINLLGIRQHVYQAMVLLCLKLGQIHLAFSYVERAKARAFLDMVSRRHLTDRLGEEHPLLAEEIQSQLTPTMALLEYYTTGSKGTNERMLAQLPQESHYLRAYLTPPERLFVFVVTQNEVSVIPLSGTLREIGAQYFYRGDSRLRGVTPQWGERLQPMYRWHRLDQQLVNPIRPFLAGQQQLYVVPHDLLHYIPLHALAINGHPVGDETANVIYAPSASILLKTVRNLKTVSQNRQSLAIGVNTGDLPHAEAEAKWVAHQLKGTALINEEATVSTVCRNLETASLIHFACHGRFRRQTPMSSSLVLADGELTAANIIQMQLQAELVVLSACDTGLNHLAHGDELIGMTRAFLSAGAQSLLVTLWPVLDIPTRLFMEAFYQAWQQGESRASAVREAQSYLRCLKIDDVQAWLVTSGQTSTQAEKYLQGFQRMVLGPHVFDHPYYWGAFLLIGNPD